MRDEETGPLLIVRPRAEEEIVEAFRWYEEKSEGLGSEFMRALDAALSSIQRNPNAYAVFHRGARKALLRRFPYNVVYVVRDDILLVVGCYHAARSPQDLNDRLEEL